MAVDPTLGLARHRTEATRSGSARHHAAIGALISATPGRPLRVIVARAEVAGSLAALGARCLVCELHHADARRRKDRSTPAEMNTMDTACISCAAGRENWTLEERLSENHVETRADLYYRPFQPIGR